MKGKKFLGATQEFPINLTKKECNSLFVGYYAYRKAVAAGMPKMWLPLLLMDIYEMRRKGLLKIEG